MSDLIAVYDDWQRAAARARPELPPMWLDDLGYDQRAQRICFHGGCQLPSACVRLGLCTGRQPFTREQQALWDEHRKPSPVSDAPYSFWLGADHG